MKQLLLRIPDDLHGRLAMAAVAEGKSMNALANELFEREFGEGNVSRHIVRAKARALGLLAETQPVPEVDEEERQAIIAAGAGSGAILDELLADGR